MPNRTALIAHHLACLKAGLVATPLNYRYTPPEIDHAVDVSGARIILAHAERMADIAGSKAGQLESSASSLTAPRWRRPELRAVAAHGYYCPPDADARAIFFTSGSTDLPGGPFTSSAWLDLARRAGLSLFERSARGILVLAFRRLQRVALGAHRRRSGGTRSCSSTTCRSTLLARSTAPRSSGSPPPTTHSV
jgi:acyl-CoA synthetase (AMP-forming)/AMP-acid ligase II